MPLQQAKEIRTAEGGDYPNLKEIAKDGDVLAVFRLIDFLPRTATTKPNVFVYPVRADLLIVSGTDANRVWFNQSFQGNAVSPTLRGARDDESPTYQRGAEIGAVIKQPTKGYAIVNAPDSEQYAQIEAAYKGFPEPERDNGATSDASVSKSSSKVTPWKRRTS
jgi:hypothetical protein